MTTPLDALLAAPGPRSLRGLAWPRPLDVLVMAPHPDDFDAIGASLRYLQGQGHRLQLAVLTGGAGGVDDGFGGAVDSDAKARLRQEEQRASCAFFGLPAQHLHFLRLWEGGDEAEDAAKLRAWMAARPFDLLFLPHGNDSNATHRRTYEAVRAVAEDLGRAAWACLNRDAKTLGMRADLHFEFGEEEAAWKAQLLRFHRSQQERNLRTRGSGFDARVLAVNRQAARELGAPLPYAEVFELMPLGRRPPA